jgi:hypothetical protein
MSDTEASDVLRGKHPTLYQLIRQHKRNATCLVRIVRDGEGNIRTYSSGIATAFTTFFQAKYANKNADPVSVQTPATLICTELPQDLELSYETPLTHTDIHTAITSGGQNIAPSRDGLRLSFYNATWPIIRYDLCLILNMFFEGVITTQQKQGTIVCLPKTNRMLTPANRRPITLLSSDYKTVTRIIAQRLRPVFEKQLSRTQ